MCVCVKFSLVVLLTLDLFSAISCSLWSCILFIVFGYVCFLKFSWVVPFCLKSIGCVLLSSL